MLIKKVLLKYHKQVPFPWTRAKIRKAGLNPSTLINQLQHDLERCADISGALPKITIDTIAKLKI